MDRDSGAHPEVRPFRFLASFTSVIKVAELRSSGVGGIFL